MPLPPPQKKKSGRLPHRVSDPPATEASKWEGMEDVGKERGTGWNVYLSQQISVSRVPALYYGYLWLQLSITTPDEEVRLGHCSPSLCHSILSLQQQQICTTH